ncbi:phospholipid-transporting ATPase IA-like [Sycon ciliatum]
MLIDKWSWLTHVCIWIGLPLWIVFLLVYCRLWPHIPIGVNLEDVDVQLFSAGLFWFMVFLLPALALALDVVVKLLLKRFRKSDEDLVLAEEAKEAILSPRQREATGDSNEDTNIYHDRESQGYGALARGSRELTELTASTRHGFAYSAPEKVNFGHRRSAVGESARMRMYDTRTESTRADGETSTVTGTNDHVDTVAEQQPY